MTLCMRRCMNVFELFGKVFGHATRRHVDAGQILIKAGCVTYEAIIVRKT
jgi:hypothetical protein